MSAHNILFLHKCFVLGGGIERVHQNLAHAIARQNVAPYFFVLNAEGDSESGYASLQSTFRTGRAPVNASFSGKVNAVFAWIKDNEIDFIIAATEQANTVAFLCKLRLPKLQIIYTRHCAFDVSDQKLPAWAIKLLYSFYALNGKIVCVSKALQTQLQNAILHNKARVHFVPNAVVDESLYEKAEQNSDNWQCVDYFIAVGRLVEQKGFDLLISAYAQALAQDPQLPDLAIVGEGEDKHQLSQLINQLGVQDKVILTGFTHNPYYPIKHAKALILSSRHEGMPTVLIEAIALDTPVIAFDCPTGPGEIVVSGKNGQLVSHLQVGELAQAILAYRDLPTHHIRQYVDHFEYANVAKAYLSLYEGAS